MSESPWYRTERLIGKDGLDRLRKSHILVVGIGGVGSHAAEALCRVGIGKITLVDSGYVKPSNCNRQVQATTKTVGLSKVKALSCRFREINPEGEYIGICKEVGQNNCAEIIPSDIDIVLDAIDSLESKAFLLIYCVRNNIPVVTCLGAGGKFDPSHIRIASLFETRNCRLGRALRKNLRRREPACLEKVTAVYSEEQPGVSKAAVVQEMPLGTLPFAPAATGISAAYAVFSFLSESR